MKRSPFVLGATVAGLAGVLTYQTHGSSFSSFRATSAPVVRHRAAGSGAAGSGSAGSGSASSGSAASGSGSGSAGSGSAGSGSAGSGSAGSGAASSGSGATSSGSGATTSTTAGPTPALSRQVTGPLVTYGYGELAVKVSLVGSKIANVSVTGLRTAEQYSQSLAQQVIPMLQSQVLQAQNANISGISGATYTSEAFASSLQKALKKVGV